MPQRVQIIEISFLPFPASESLKYNEMDNEIKLNKSKVKNSNKFPLIIERKVEDKLIKYLYVLEEAREY